MDQAKDSPQAFQAPMAYVILFYLLLLAWTVGTLPFIYVKFQNDRLLSPSGSMPPWSLFVRLYLVLVSGDLLPHLTGWRGADRFEKSPAGPAGHGEADSYHRGIALSAGFGFIKMKLPQENGYLFCCGRNRELEEILLGIRKMNPLVKTVRI